jgi:hypothetical protein
MAKESEESQELDPTQLYLTHLRARRDQLDQLIKMVESGGDGAALPAASATPPVHNSASEGPGAFLGMTVADATVKLLGIRRKPLSNNEIHEAIIAGGVVMKSVSPLNTIGTILRRRQEEVEDIVRVGKTWGLAAWYHNASRFSRRGKKEKAD